jgi:hypothetical protein
MLREIYDTLKTLSYIKKKKQVFLVVYIARI